VTAKATDAAGNVEASPRTIPFTFDTQAPDLAITKPEPGATIAAYSNNIESTRPLTVLSGTAVDGGSNPSGVSQVWVGISSGAANAVWFNDATSAFDTNQATIFFTTSLAGPFNPWSYNQAGLAAALQDGNLYTVFARARDAAGNLKGYVTSPNDAGAVKQSFLFDLSRPTSVVTLPNLSFHNASLTSFSGTALDSSPGLVSGLDTVYVAVQASPPGGNWWNWALSGFTDATLTDANWTPVFSTTTPSVASIAWSTPIPSGMLANGNTYRVVTYAKDRATNHNQAAATGAGAGKTFTYQNTAPSVAISFPAHNGKYNAGSLAAMSGTSADAISGVTSVEVLLKSTVLGYWNGGTSGTVSDWDNSPATRYTRWQTVTGTTNWTKAFPPLGLLDGDRLYLWVRASNNAGNTSPIPSNAQLDANLDADNTAARTFFYDNTAPLSALTQPSNNAFVKDALPLVSGTSADPVGAGNPTGVVDVSFLLRRSDGNFFQPASNNWGSANPGFSNIGVTGLNPWTRSFAAGTFQDGYQYRMNSQATDAAMNVETAFSTTTFVVDLTTPVAQVLNPANNAWLGFGALGSGLALSGTADDSVENLEGFAAPRDFESGIASGGVSFSAQRLSDGLFWGGTSFDQPTQTFVPASFVGTASGTWTATIPSSALTDGASYFVTARAQDRAANLQTALTSLLYKVDLTSPTSLATFPTGTQNQVTTLSGTAQDAPPGELEVVRIRVFDTTASQFWNGTSWQTTEVFIASGTLSSPTGQPATWSYAAPTNMFVGKNGNTFQVTALARDRAGNTKAAPGTADLTFTILANPAVATITQPASPNDLNYKTAAAAVATFQGTGTDLAPAGNNVQIRLKRETDGRFWYDPNQAWVAVDTYVVVSANTGTPGQPWSYSLSFPTATYVLDNASYTLSVNGINYVGQLGPADSRRFVIDNTAPVATIASPNTPFHRTVPVLSGTANDPGNPTPPSFQSLALRIKDPNGLYWNGTSFVSGLNEIAASFSYPGAGTAVNWSSHPALALKDGGDYTILVNPTDKAANAPPNEGAMASFTITFDTQPPTAAIAQPLHQAVLTNLTTLSGTAADPAGANFAAKKSDLLQVEVSIQDITPGFGQFWSGTGFNVFSGTGYWVLAQGTDTWSYTKPNLDASLTSGHRYLVLSRAFDKASNIQSTFGVAVSSSTFGIDRSSPTTAINAPAHNGAFKPQDLSGVSAFTGTASDAEDFLYVGNDALQQVELALWYLDAGTSFYWNGTLFTSALSEEAAFQPVTSGTTAWNYSFAAASWVSDKPYRLKARARDKAGNVQTAFTPGTNLNSFIVDATPPASLTTLPSSGSFVNALPLISGTANADLSGLSKLELALKDETANLYWSGTQWVSQAISTLPATLTVFTGTVTWTFDASGVPLTSGNRYSVTAKATDAAGNVEASPRTVLFVFDATLPTAVVQAPVSGAFYGPSAAFDPARTLPTISGTAADPGSSPAGVTRIEVRVRNVTDSTFWNGSTFTATETFNLATGTSTWTYASPAWIGQKQYSVSVLATDGANNQFLSPASTFIFDDSVPLVQIQAPSMTFVSQLPAISGTAGETALGQPRSGLDRVQVSIQENPPTGNFFDGTGFTIPSTELGLSWRNVSGVTAGADSANWSTVSTPTWVGGQTYLVRARAIDRSGNISSIASHQFTFETARPVTAITAPPNTSVNPGTQRISSLPAIFGTAANGAGNVSGIQRVEVRIRDNTLQNKWWNTASSAFDILDSNKEAAWFIVTGTGPWSHPFTWTNDVQYTINARSLDNAGLYDIVTDTAIFRFDNQPPLSFVNEPPAGSVRNTFAGVSGTAGDQGSFPGAVPQLSVAIRRNSDGFFWNGLDFAGPAFVSIPLTPDGSGNWSYTGLVASKLQSGTSYYVTTSAQDDAAPPNAEAFFNVRGSTFSVDYASPTAVVTVPSGEATRNLIRISGTAFDDFSGVARVEIAWQDVTPGAGLYWSFAGESFSLASSSFGTVSGTTNWSYTNTGTDLNTALTDGHRYVITARATDPTGKPLRSGDFLRRLHLRPHASC